MPTQEELLQQISSYRDAHPEAFSKEEADLFRPSRGLSETELTREPGSSLIGTAKQLAEGFLQSFTTLNIDDPPVGSTEAIARNIGSLLGFEGFIPGPGIIGKLGLSGVIKGSGMIARGIRSAEAMAQAGNLGIHMTSVPMGVANYVMKGIGSTAKLTAAADAIKFLKAGSMGRDLLEGGLHLGIASAVGAAQPWELKIDERMKAFVDGVAVGTVFRGFGNLISKGGKLDVAAWVGAPEDKIKAVNNIARAFASSAYMGLPSTLRDYPTELQVYEYALGAYFGAGELTRHQRYVREVTSQYRGSREVALLDPKNKVAEYAGMTPEAKEEMDLQSAHQFGRYIRMADELAPIAEKLGAISSGGVILGGAKFNAMDRVIREYGMEQAAKMMWIPESALRRAYTGEALVDTYEKVLPGVIDANPKATPDEIHTIAVETTKSLVVSAHETQVKAEAERQVAMQSPEAQATQVENKVATMGMYNYSPQEKAWHSELEKQDVPSHFVQPLELFSGKVYDRLGKNAPATVYDVRMEMAKLAGNALKSEWVSDGKTDGYDKFRDTVAEKYNVRLADGDLAQRMLRQSWLRLRHEGPMRQATLDLTNGLSIVELKPGDLNAIGEDVSEVKAKSPFENETGIPLIEVKSLQGTLPYRLVDTEGVPQLDDAGNAKIRMRPQVFDDLNALGIDKKRTPLLDRSHLIMVAHANGTPVVSGLKDKNVILLAGEYTKAIKAEGRPAVDQLLNEAFDAHGKTAYQIELDRFAANVTRLGFSPAQAKDAFDFQYANNIELAKILNHKDNLVDIIGDGYIKSAAGLNKRVPVLNSGDIPWDPSRFKGVADLVDGKFRFIIANSTGSTDDHRLYESVEGKAVPVSSETGRDGGIFTRQDVFDAGLVSMGQDVKSGFMKNVAEFADDRGMFLSKRGMHRADDDLNTWMMENNVHHIEFDTTAKQRGDRGTVTLDREGEGKYVVNGGALTPDQVYTMPITAIRGNMGVAEEVKSQLKNLAAPIQYLSNINLADGGGRAVEAVRSIVKGIDKGDEVHNAFAAANDHVNVDVSKLGTQEILNIVASDKVERGPLYEKVIKHIMGKSTEDVDFANYDGAKTVDREELQADLDQMRTAAKKVLHLWEKSPATMNHVFTMDYTDVVLRNYLLDRLVKPNMTDSMKSYLVPHSWKMRADGIRAGEYKLGEDARDKQIDFEGERVKLGDAWDMYRELRDSEKPTNPTALADHNKTLAGMEDALTHVVMRVPADDTSGVRVLRFWGFTGLRGTGIALHDTDMRYIGGADTDADSAFIFTKNHPDVKAYYANLDIQMARHHPVKDVMGHTQFVMGEVKSSAMDKFFLVDRSKQELDHEVSTGAMWSPLTRLEVGNDAALGNENLGAMLALSRRLRVVNDIIGPDGRTVNDVHLKPNFEMQRRLQIEAVNRAADASDGGRLRPLNNLRQMLLNEGMHATREGKPVPVTEGILAEIPEYAPMIAADNFLKGKNRLTGHAYSLGEMIQGLRGAGERLAEVPNSWFMAGNALGSKVVTESPFNFVGRDANLRIQKEFTQIMGSRSPVAILAREIIGRSYLGFPATYKYELQERFARLSTWRRVREGRMYLSQDFSDMSSAKFILERGEKVLEGQDQEVGLAKLADIAQMASASRAQEMRRRRNEAADAHTARHKLIKLDFDATQNYLETKAYYEKLNPAERGFFDAYVLGSISKETMTWPEFNAKMDIDLQRNFAGVKSAEYEKYLKEQTRLWHQTSQRPFGFELDFINPESIKRYGEIYNDMVSLGAREVSPEELKTHLLGTSLEKAPAALTEAIEATPLTPEEPLKETGRVDAAALIPEAVERLLKPLTVEPSRLDFAKSLSEIKLSEREQKMRDDLAEVYYNYPHLIAAADRVFAGEIARINGDAMPIDERAATLRMVEMFVNRFKQRGEFFQDIVARGPLKRSQWDWFLMPERLGEKHLPYDMRFNDKLDQPIITPEGGTRTDVKVLTSGIGFEVSNWQKVMSLMSAAKNAARMRWEEDWRPLRKLGVDGALIYRMAVATRERANAEREGAPAYEEQYKKVKGEYDTRFAVDAGWLVPDAKGTTHVVKAPEMLAETIARMTDWSKRGDLLRRDQEAERKYIDAFRDKSGWIDMRAALNHLQNKMLNSNQPESLGHTLVDQLAHQQAVERVSIGPGGWTIGDLNTTVEKRKAANELMKRNPETYGWLKYKNPESMPHENFYPHNGHVKSIVDARLKEIQATMAGKNAADRLSADLDMRQEVLGQALPDGGIGGHYEEAHMRPILDAKNIIEAGLHVHLNSNQHRSSGPWAPMPGYDMTPDALLRYENQYITATYNTLGSVLAHETIKKFEQSKVMGDQTAGWAAFMRIFNRDQLGMASMFPKEYLADKRTKIRGGLYYRFTDQFWLDKIQRIQKENFNGKELLKIEPRLRTELEYAKTQFAAMADSQGKKRPSVDKEAFKQAERELSRTQRAYDRRDVQATANRQGELTRKAMWLSTLEGKYEMMTLLAHTKTMFPNVIGMGLNTVMDTGLKPFKMAMSFPTLKAGAFHADEFRSMADINKFADTHGASESFMLDIIPRSEREGLRNLLNDLRSQKDPNVTKVKLSELAAKHHVGESVMEFASLPMRVSETMARRKSWIAHYVKFRDVLEVNNMTMEADHPWLIEQATNGANASQFIFNNSYRPAFARTNLGKVYGRFQMWAWQSVKFRNDIFKGARESGFTAGDPNFEKFKRMMVADLFVMGLASIYPMSMFQASLPQPWSWFQDAADFFFGNKQEREKAFFGMKPYPFNLLQAVLPPSGRALDPFFVAVTGGDWEKWASYGAWTLFPFGRVGRAAYKTMQNPVMWQEQWIGFPIHQIQTQVTRGRKRESTQPHPGAILGQWNHR